VYGVTHFDPAVVAALVARDPGAITEEGIQCPLRGHGELLAWRGGQRRVGTEWHADPEVSFHVSPTYVLRHFKDNLIAGHEVIAETFAKKAETQRLGHENSEDALSWNVFRALQEAGALSLATCSFTGTPSEEEPALYVWGQRLTAGGVLPGTISNGRAFTWNPV